MTTVWLYIFQQDSAPLNIPNMTREWLDREFSLITYLFWFDFSRLLNLSTSYSITGPRHISCCQLSEHKDIRYKSYMKKKGQLMSEKIWWIQISQWKHLMKNHKTLRKLVSMGSSPMRIHNYFSLSSPDLKSPNY